MTCEVEVAEAANWFGEQLFEPNEQREIFTKRLKVCARPDFGRAHPAPCKVAKAFPPDPPPLRGCPRAGTAHRALRGALVSGGASPRLRLSVHNEHRERA